MKTVFSACLHALRDLKHPRILAVMVLPVLASLAIWFVIAVWFWQSWVTVLGDLIGSTQMARWLRDWGAQWLVNGMGAVALIALMIPALLITNMVITEIFAMPVMVKLVSERDYPALEKRNGGTAAGSVFNASVGITIFLVLFFLSLPLWLLGPVGLIAGALNSAYLAQRLFRYDALSDHAGADEYRALVKNARGRLFLMGLVLAPLNFVPFLNLFAPVLGGLAYTHFCLRELNEWRRRAS
ncbi:MAG: EI24 domain-containing protein [Burkholderiales bacterium]